MNQVEAQLQDLVCQKLDPKKLIWTAEQLNGAVH